MLFVRKDFTTENRFLGLVPAKLDVRFHIDMSWSLIPIGCSVLTLLMLDGLLTSTESQLLSFRVTGSMFPILVYIMII